MYTQKALAGARLLTPADQSFPLLVSQGQRPEAVLLALLRTDKGVRADIYARETTDEESADGHDRTGLAMPPDTRDDGSNAGDSADLDAAAVPASHAADGQRAQHAPNAAATPQPAAVTTCHAASTGKADHADVEVAAVGAPQTSSQMVRVVSAPLQV
jgi:hypothetical protein